MGWVVGGGIVVKKMLPHVCLWVPVSKAGCYALITKTPISHFHDLSLDLFLSGLVWLQICYAEVQSSIIDGYLAFLKVRYLF